MHKTLPILGAVLGFGLAANGLYMLANPANWYFLVPGVTTTGPFNQHFLRDIGLIYLMTGAALAVGAARPKDRAVLWTAAALWHAGHACFHFWEVSVGICGPSALARDFPAVTLPTLVMLALAGWSLRERMAGREMGALPR